MKINVLFFPPVFQFSFRCLLVHSLHFSCFTSCGVFFTSIRPLSPTLFSFLFSLFFPFPNIIKIRMLSYLQTYINMFSVTSTFARNKTTYTFIHFVRTFKEIGSPPANIIHQASPSSLFDAATVWCKLYTNSNATTNFSVHVFFIEQVNL